MVHIKYKDTSEEEKEKRREACRRWAAKNDRSEYYKEYEKSGRSKESKELKKVRNKEDRQKNPEKHKEYRARNYAKNKSNWTPQTTEYQMYKAAKVRAKKKGLDFNIETSDVVIPEYCPVFPWLRLETGKGKVHKGSPTIDRVDNNKGYTKDNIAVISYYANSIKQNASSEELRAVADWMDSFGK